MRHNHDSNESGHNQSNDHFLTCFKIFGVIVGSQEPYIHPQYSNFCKHADIYISPFLQIAFKSYLHLPLSVINS